MPKTKLLILDDSPTVREVIKIYLMGGDFEFHVAENAERALQLCRLIPLDLIVADIKMPGMNGIDFVKTLRRDMDLRLSKLPVILLTGEKGPELRKQGMEAGASAFVEKPVTGPKLRETIAEVLAAPRS